MFLSCLNKGVPVIAIYHAFGKAFCILILNVPCWVRCPSSIKTKIFGLVKGFLIPLTAVSNLLIMVVTTLSELLSKISMRCFPVLALSTCIPTAAKVLEICWSKSVLSVTKIIFGFLILSSFAIAFAIIAIVSDFPLPWVCQTTPPKRFPSPPTPLSQEEGDDGGKIVLILSTADFTAKYC